MFSALTHKEGNWIERNCKHTKRLCGAFGSWSGNVRDMSALWCSKKNNRYDTERKHYIQIRG